jgi:hypothetical protein
MVANKVVTEGGNYVSNQVNVAARAAFEEFVDEFRVLRDEVREDRKYARYYLIICVLCAVSAGISMAFSG